MLEFLKENWKFLALLIIFIFYVVNEILDFSKLSSEEKKIRIKEWLLFAVTEAEKKFGSGTGQLKLSYVYNMFIERFPVDSSLITFEIFSGWVDEVLDKFRGLLQSNNNIENYVNPTTEVEDKQ